MSGTRMLRGVTVIGALVLSMTMAIHPARAQEEVSDAAKPKKTAVKASGDVVIAGVACSPLAAGVACYSITSSTLKDGKVSNGSLTGTLMVSTTAKTKKNTVCYTVLSTSTETLTIGTAVTKLDFGPANACIVTNTKKKTSSEAVTPAAAWKSATGSAETGSGKETWKVTPTNPTSPTSPLAGSGTVMLTGSETP